VTEHGDIGTRCYAESLPRCRRFVAGDPDRFARLLREQLTPRDLDGPR
jgi:hypothetical protein